MKKLLILYQKMKKRSQLLNDDNSAFVKKEVEKSFNNLIDTYENAESL